MIDDRLQVFDTAHIYLISMVKLPWSRQRKCIHAKTKEGSIICCFSPHHLEIPGKDQVTAQGKTSK